MLRLCAVRKPRQLPSAATCHNLKPYQIPVRHSSSSTSDRARRYPGSESTSILKPWQKALLVGITVGLAAGQAVKYYDRTQLRNSFITYRLVSREPVSSTASIFCLEPKTTSDTLDKYQAAWKAGIWNVHFKQPQIQIVRAYTPLPPVVNEKGQTNDKQLRFLIRHDPHGEVSGYLHRLPIGSDIEARGPNVEYQLTPDIQQVVFFAGGTGIAPALQIAHSMFAEEGTGEKDKNPRGRKLHILWANRRREDCLGGVSDAPVAEPIPAKPTWSGLFAKPKDKPVVQIGEERGLLVKELEELKKRYPGQVTVEYFVNAEGSWIDEDVVFRTLSRFDDKDFSTGYATPQEQRQILISGPSGFISYLAGPKEWRNGREEQGHVSKIIAHAIAQNPHHVKVWKI